MPGHRADPRPRPGAGRVLVAQQHQRHPHGRHRTAGTTGENSDTTGVPTAAARCAGPVLPTTHRLGPGQHLGQPGQIDPPAEVDHPWLLSPATSEVSDRSSLPPVTTTRRLH